jgi:flagellar basal-body rod modification protein FlgD
MVNAASAMPAAVTTLPVGNQAPPPTGGANQPLNQADFLQLMTAQLEKQNPLNPLTGAEFAAELAQFSTAQGVQGLQTGLTGLGSSLAGMQATGLVGHSVAVSGNSLMLGATGSATGALNLAGAANDVSVTIADATGKPVATLDLGPMVAGMQTFSWSAAAAGGGQAPPGTYSFSVHAIGAKGGAVAAAPYAVVPVTAVAFGGQSGPMLELGGGFAPMALNAVQQVF